jgi:hypothetical protein
VSQIETVANKLKELPPAKLQQVADLVYRLQETQRAERQRALTETAGFMSATEADAFQRSIDEACEGIDADENERLR